MSGGYLNSNQKKKLIELVSKDPQLLRGKFSAGFTFKDSQRRWMAITEQLNAIEGAKKDFKHWRKTWQDLRSKAKSKNVTLIRSSEPGDEPPAPEARILNPADEKILQLMEPATVKGSYLELDETQVEFDFVDLDSLPAAGRSKRKSLEKAEPSSREPSPPIEFPRITSTEASPIEGQQTSISSPRKRETQFKPSSKVPNAIENKSKRYKSDNSQFHNKVIALLTKHVECTQNYHNQNLTLLMKQVEFTQNYQAQKLAVLTRLAEAQEIAKSKTNL